MKVQASYTISTKLPNRMGHCSLYWPKGDGIRSLEEKRKDKLNNGRKENDGKKK